MKSTGSIAVLLVTVALMGCSDPGFDKTRYNKMRHVIQGSTSNMLGMTFADASRLLSLEGVNWERGYDNYPLGEWRIYHFRGFYLGLHLSVRPQGVLLGQGYSITNEPELRGNGVWWVDSWKPFLQIDKLTDPKQRMSNHWAKVEEGFRVRSRVAEELWKTNRTR